MIFLILSLILAIISFIMTKENPAQIVLIGSVMMIVVWAIITEREK